MSLILNSTNNLRGSKSKASTKPIHSPRNTKKEKHGQTNIDEKMNSRFPERSKSSKIVSNTNFNQHKSISRQKHQQKNQQPVWRPGGAAKIPSSNSTSMLKPCLSARMKDKLNYSERKKHPSEIHSSRDLVPILNLDHLTCKRSCTSLKTSPRMKSKVKSTSISSRTESLYKPSTNSKNLKNAHAFDLDKQKILKESKISSQLEELTKPVTSLEEETKIKINQSEKLQEDKPEFVETSKAFSQTLITKKNTEIVPMKLENLQGPSCFAFESNCANRLEDSKLNETSTSSSVVSCQAINKKNEKCDDSLNCNEKQEKCDLFKKSKINVSKKDMTKANPHAVSLSALKEFLCDQGIDVDLVNKDERFLKQKTRLKKKSISFADMPSSVECKQRSKKTIKREFCKDYNLENNVEISKEHFDDETSVGCLPKKKEIATNTTKNYSNAYSQTVIHCKISRSLQTIPEIAKDISKSNVLKATKVHATETQTDVEVRNVSSMTEAFPDKIKFPSNVESAKIKENSNKECSLLYQQLLHQLDKESNESIDSKQADSTDPLSLDESDSLDSTTGSLQENCEETNAVDDEKRPPVKAISSEIVAALQVAAIRARNVYKAIEIYKRKLRNKTVKKRRKRTIEKIFKAHKRETIIKSRSNSTVKMTVQREKSDVIEMSRILRESEITSACSAISFDSRSESEEELASPTETFILPKKSSSVVLRDVKSLVEFLINETDTVKFESVKKIRKTNSRMKLSENTKIEAVNVRKRFSLFSRENLLPLVYGIVCSIVFWCLQFTITCDASL